jgi:hypothetical protein
MPPGTQEAAQWTLEVQPTPTPATVGQLVQFAVALNQDGQVFPHATWVAIEARHVEDDKVVFRTTMSASDGQTSPRLQFFDGAPHTVAVTARPANGDDTTVTPLQTVVALDVVSVHPPVAVKIRTMALLLSVLVVGMVVGFFLPRTGKG